MANVLLVDDEPRILSLLHSLLKSEGLSVVSERDGAAAIKRIETEPLDLIVSDIRMSPIDGMEVFRVARREQPDTPVILLTAYGAVDTAIEAMKGGAFDYLTKPFKVDELLITVRRALSFRSLVFGARPFEASVGRQLRLRKRRGAKPPDAHYLRDDQARCAD